MSSSAALRHVAHGRRLLCLGPISRVQVIRTLGRDSICGMQLKYMICSGVYINRIYARTVEVPDRRSACFPLVRPFWTQQNRNWSQTGTAVVYAHRLAGERVTCVISQPPARARVVSSGSVRSRPLNVDSICIGTVDVRYSRRCVPVNIQSDPSCNW